MKWEYLTVTQDGKFGPLSDRAMTRMMGRQRWELVAVVPTQDGLHYVFKRELIDRANGIRSAVAAASSNA